MKTASSKHKVTRQRAARRAPPSAGPADPQLIADLVAANRILADHGVRDGYGHVSARHDRDPNRYLLSRSLAPALVAANDIMEYDLVGKLYAWNITIVPIVVDISGAWQISGGRTDGR